MSTPSADTPVDTDEPGFASTWHDWMTAVLVGADRRPVVLGGADPAVRTVTEVVQDAELHRPEPRRGDPDPARRAIRLLATAVVARRAGLTPGPSRPPCVPTEPIDERPLASAVAVALWHRIVTDGEILAEEWVQRTLLSGRRIPPALVPEMLQRWVDDPVAHARVRAAAGPVADWLISLSPRLGARSKAPVDPDAVRVLTDLSLVPALSTILTQWRAGAPRPLAPLLAWTQAGVYADHFMGARFVAVLSPDELHVLAAALDPRRDERAGFGLGPTLLDLTELRLALIAAHPLDRPADAGAPTYPFPEDSR